MSLSLEQIENSFGKAKAYTRKWLKNQRNRKIRRTNKEEKPNIKYKGYEY